MKVLITGAAGHVGSAATRALLGDGHEVRGLVHNRAKAERRLAGLDVELVEGDVRRTDDLVRALDDTDAVVHLVAIAIERGGKRYEEINYQGTLNVLEAMERTGVDRIVHMGQVGSGPDVPYRFLRTKGQAQEAVTGSDRAWTVLRPSIIFGPTDEFARTLAYFLKLAPVFPMPGDGSAEFQPIALQDVAAAIARVLAEPDDVAADGDERSLQPVGTVYELGGPEVLRFDEITERILEAMDARRAVLRIPVPLMRPLVSVLERVLPNPGVTTSLLDLLAVDNVAPDSATVRLLGRPATPFSTSSLAYLADISYAEALGYFVGRTPPERHPASAPTPPEPTDADDDALRSEG